MGITDPAVVIAMPWLSAGLALGFSLGVLTGLWTSHRQDSR